MDKDPEEAKKKESNRQREVSIFADPAVWSEQAEALYMMGEPQEDAIGDTTKSDGSAFSSFGSTFSDISNSIITGMYAMGSSDPYGDDSYLQQDSSIEAQESSIEQMSEHTGQKPKPTKNEKQKPKQNLQDYFDRNHDDHYNRNKHRNQQKSRTNNQVKHQQRSKPHISPKTQYRKDAPRTPPRTAQEEEEYLKQKEAINSMTPKTEVSNSENTTVMSALVDERCCGIFRRAFEEESIFRSLVHTAVIMLILFSILSIYVIIRSSETNRAKAALPSPTAAPLDPQQPTRIRPPSPFSGKETPAPSFAPSKWVPTVAPTRLTATALRELVLQAFPQANTAIGDPSSPQARALAWLTSDDSMDAFFVTEKLIQRWALAVLYFSTNGEEWKTQDKWLTNNDECEWYSADSYTPVCDDSGLVNSLHLRNNGLRGTLPDELILLSNSLEFLYLNDGMLEGTIPSSYGKLSNLKRFYLQVNQLRGPIPDEISGMETLENLAIGRNQLSGTIPTLLQSMEELRLIDMSANRIGGSLPAVLGNLPKLASFLVNENRLTGTIPSEFGDLTALTTLLVQDNRLTGEVPASVCEMRNIQTFFWIIVDCEAVTCIEECRCQCS